MRGVEIDFHVHTRVSPDGLDAPEVVVRAARDAGLDAIAITDHDRSAGYRRLVELGLADPSGLPVDGFLVIPGVEVSTTSGHVLVIGSTFDTPARRGGISIEQLSRRARALSAPGPGRHAPLLVAAHPLDRTRSGVGEAAVCGSGFDAVEVFNSKTLDRAANARAGALAERLGLPGIGGSDAHCAWAVGRARTVVDVEEFTIAGVLAGVRCERTRVIEGLHTPREVAAYIARGWLTRPWIADWLGRAAASVAGDLRPLRRRTPDAEPLAA